MSPQPQPGPLAPSRRQNRTLTGSSMLSSSYNDGGADAHHRPATFSSALTEAWNTCSSSNNKFSPENQHQQARTTCLFCSNLVLLSSNGGGGAEDPKKRSRMIKNLCIHMQISSKDIPSQCSRTKFPLCKLCEGLVNQLWDFQGMLDKLKLKISEVVGKIERTVVDGEILSPKLARPSASSLSAALENEKFIQLRNMILDGYRNKLIMKQQIQNNLVLSNPISSVQLSGGFMVKTECIIENESLDLDLDDCASVSSSLNLDPPSVDRSDEIVDMVVNEEVIELPEALPSSSSPPIAAAALTRQSSSPDIAPTIEQQRQSFSSEERIEQHLEDRESFSSEEGSLRIDETGCEPEDNEDNEWTVDPAVIAQYTNDSSSTLVISNIHGSGETETTNDAARSLVQIKQEISGGESLVELNVDMDDDDFEPSNSEADDEDDDDIFMLEQRKRRMMFGNVEIFKCFGSSKHGGECLQCSICDHKVTIPKKAGRGDVTPIMKMKLHIQSVHRRDAVIPIGNVVPPKRLFTCVICSKTFTRGEYLREHRKRHSPDETVECDICGRPLKSSSYFNLMMHKFSHKNDEERMAAIAAGETGTSCTLLSKRLKVKKAKAKSKPKRKEVVKKKEQKQKNDVAQNSFKCQICYRFFSKQCYLTLHMRAHVTNYSLWGNIPVLVEQEEQRPVDHEPPLLLAREEETVDTLSDTQRNGNPTINNQEANEKDKQSEPEVNSGSSQNDGGNDLNGINSNVADVTVTLPILKREIID